LTPLAAEVASLSAPRTTVPPPENAPMVCTALPRFIVAPDATVSELVPLKPVPVSAYASVPALTLIGAPDVTSVLPKLKVPPPVLVKPDAAPVETVSMSAETPLATFSVATAGQVIDAPTASKKYPLD
jgi:hypothetical protein